jgi:hypothetical protein
MTCKVDGQALTASLTQPSDMGFRPILPFRMQLSQLVSATPNAEDAASRITRCRRVLLTLDR